MKYSIFIFLLILTCDCTSQEKVSQKLFEQIALVNKIDFVDPKYDQPRFSCGFLLKFNNDTFAVTAKHLLEFIKPEQMRTLSFDGLVKNWSLYPLDKKEETIITDKLLNQDKTEKIDRASYGNDWLVFTIKENNSHAKTLIARTTPLTAEEKLYVIGWTRKMENGSQRVYEFEYYKMIKNRILLKEVIVPEQFGCLSGGPVVDEQGLVVGIVSGSTVDPETDKKYFSPCLIGGLLSFLEKFPK